MTAHKIAVKLFATSNEIHGETFVPVFHHWIQNQAIADHMLIDVADYAHVPDGPGTVLVSHEANIYADREGGKLGLLYTRKQPVAGTFRDRLKQAIGATLNIASLLQRAPEFDGKLSFATGEILIRINDRLLAPNTSETFTAVKVDIEAVGRELLGDSVTVEHYASPLGVFEVAMKSSNAGDVQLLVDKLPVPANV